MKKIFDFPFFTTVLVACTMMFCFSACGGDDDTPPPSNQNPSGNPSSNDPEDSQGTFEVMRACYTCRGKKTCIDCKGSGHGCGRCDGTGKNCYYCGGVGKHGRCNGTGRCKDCGGDGIAECEWCYRGQCKTCAGVGNIRGTTCAGCYGSGKCSHCRGTYQFRCSNCSGSGSCPECSGGGLCPICKGDPTCTACGGDGHCLTCKGNGQCADCGGKGEESLRLLAFDDTAESETIYIHSTSSWTISTDVDWVKFSLSSGSGDKTISAMVDKNPTTNLRAGHITFTSGNSKTTIDVTQLGEAIRLDVSSSYVFVWSWGDGDVIQVSSNTSWTVKAADSWVKCSPSSGTGDATVTVSSSNYYDGTRFSMLTFSDTSGGNSTEVVVAQALYPDAVNVLKNLMEKPLGTIDLDAKTATYQQVKTEIEKSYKVDANAKYKYVYVYSFDNESLSNLVYQGLTFYSYNFNDGGSYNNIEYHFDINKSEVKNDYKNYLDNILQDFKYTMGAVLTDEGSNQYYVALWSGRDANNNLCGIRVREYTNEYSFQIYHYYSK